MANKLDPMASFKQIITLQDHFPTRSKIDNDRYQALIRYFEKVNQAHNDPGFTFQYHHQEYAEQCKNSYSYTQFMEHYHRKHTKLNGSMKLEHQAAQEVFVWVNLLKFMRLLGVKRQEGARAILSPA